MTQIAAQKQSYQERKQLNLEVGLEVMRFEKGSGPKSASDGTTYYDGFFKRYWADDCGPVQSKFTPLEDMTDAMEVANRVLSRHSKTDFSLNYDSQRKVWTASFDLFSFSAPKSEEAICGAALLFVRK